MQVPQLYILRFLAALAIVVFHYGLNLFENSHWALKNVVFRSNQAVTFFFFLSGFVMFLAYQNKELSWWEYMKRRLARIAPLYYLAFVLTLLAILFINDARPKGDTIILQGLMVQAWLPGKALDINYPAWSVSVEMFFYLCFPFFLQWFRQQGEKRFILMVLIIWLVCQTMHILLADNIISLQSEHHYQLTLYNPLLHLGTFLSGMLTAIFFIKLNKTSPQNLTRWRLLWLSCALLLLLIMASDNKMIPYGHNGLFSPLYAGLLIGIGLDQGKHIWFLSNRVFIWLGQISYGMYILQAFVAIIVVEQLGGNFFALLLALILFSGLSYRFFEEPVKRYILRRKKS